MARRTSRHNVAKAPPDTARQRKAEVEERLSTVRAAQGATAGAGPTDCADLFRETSGACRLTSGHHGARIEFLSVVRRVFLDEMTTPTVGVSGVYYVEIK